MKKISLLVASISCLLLACGSSSDKKEEKTEVPVAEATVPEALSPYLDSLSKANEAQVVEAGDNITRAFVLENGSIELVAAMRSDHRIFGYESPDTKAKKLILFSIFTNDVEGNPFELALGAYYQTYDLKGMTLKYQEKTGDFIKASVTEDNGKVTEVYFEKKWIVFDTEMD